MKSKLLALVGMALLGGSLAAQASAVTYDFTVNGGSSGPLANVSSSGTFTFDSSIIPSGFIAQRGLFTALSFTWDGIPYNASTANTGSLEFDSAGTLVEAYFATNCFYASACGIGTSAWIASWTLSGLDSSENFTYLLPTFPTALFGSVTITKAQPTSVPEPGTLALFGLGLLGLTLVGRRRSA